MSPILVRPVREQLEHDRIIRLLTARLKRRYEVAANIGDEHLAGIKVGAGQMFPDLVLTSTDRNPRVEAIVEVETGESVNHLEAMAQWAHFGRTRAAFHLYVPATAVEMVRRLCAENQVTVTELWTYHTIGDQTRFTLAQRAPAEAAPVRKPRAGAAASARSAAKPARRPRKTAPAARPQKSRGARPKPASGARAQSSSGARTQKRK
ncbi:MAG TPA: hypothetical protein VFX12_00185 [Vicinamibacterales bacterium]|nr:hypothetical protein [Vicinamibacterales bacterium]